MTDNFVSSNRLSRSSLHVIDRSITLSVHLVNKFVKTSLLKPFKPFQIWIVIKKPFLVTPLSHNVVLPGNRAICKCPPGYTGDPFVRCNADPCSENPCGVNADCTSTGNRAVCKCRQGYEVCKSKSFQLSFGQQEFVCHDIIFILCQKYIWLSNLYLETG